MKFAKSFKYAHRGHDIVSYEPGDECPDDAFETAMLSGVLEGSSASKKKPASKKMQKPLENKGS